MKQNFTWEIYFPCKTNFDGKKRKIALVFTTAAVPVGLLGSPYSQYGTL
jgi:hypothetical protein